MLYLIVNDHCLLCSRVCGTCPPPSCGCWDTKTWRQREGETDSSRMPRNTSSVSESLYSAAANLCADLLTYAFSLAGSIGHQPRNATVFCPWPSSPSLSWCIPSPLFLFLCLCQVFCGLPLPWGFHVMAWRVIVSGGFLSVYTCPIHLHFILFCAEMVLK